MKEEKEGQKVMGGRGKEREDWGGARGDGEKKGRGMRGGEMEGVMYLMLDNWIPLYLEPAIR